MFKFKSDFSKKLFIISLILTILLSISIFSHRTIKVFTPTNLIEYNYSLFNKPDIEDVHQEHYTFDGFYLDKEFTKKYENEFNFFDYSIYAKLIPTTYKLTYLDNNEEINYIYNEPFELRSSEKLWHDFDGWFINDKEVKDVHKIGGDIQLTPKYTPQSFNITYDLNGGEIVSGQLIDKYTYGDNFNLPTLKKDGYIFSGWYSSGDRFTNVTSDMGGNIHFEAVFKSLPPEGSAGRIYVGNYTAALHYSTSQSDVDRVDTAVIFNLDGKNVIGDHNYQGFSASYQNNSMEWIKDGVSTTYYKVSSYQGVNTVDDLVIGDVPIRSFGDSSLVTYTCLDRTGVPVMITFWSQ